MKNRVSGKRLKRHIKKKPSRIQIISTGFFIIIAVGTLLLMTPPATADGKGADFVTSFFTATSATCVTGLIVQDTCTYWSLFGQLVILLLIQTGGLGFMSIGIFLLVFFKKRVSIRDRGLMQESVSALQESGMVRLVKLIIAGTALIELTGAILLSIRFIPRFGIARGIYYSIFHSVSAFCNGGFDLMGCIEPYCSLTPFYGDYLVNAVIMALITVGGLGFLVWQDIKDKGLRIKKYRLHTKIVLMMTFSTLAVSTVLFLVFEWNNTMQGMTIGQKLMAAMFSSVTARTAGFNTVDTGMLTDSGKLLTVLLMFMGGSPGSTAGGIKTTTVVVVFLYLWSNMRNETGCNIYGRRLEDEVIKRASLVFYINLFMAVIACMVICALQRFEFIDVVFEVFSAIGTAGMTTGITRSLNTASKLIIILLMYCGRVGSMTFAMSFIEKRTNAPVRLPVEKITVG